MTTYSERNKQSIYFIRLFPDQNTLSIPGRREYCLRFWFTTAILSHVIALVTWASLPLDVPILSGIVWFLLLLPWGTKL